MRKDKRRKDELRNVTVEDSVPHWMLAQGIPGGWVTAEYAMLPRSPNFRVKREQWGYSGRTQEIRLAAVSVGVVDGMAMLDLCYEEDSTAEVDFNVVMSGKSQFIEVQGTAERETFSRSNLDELLNLAQLGIGKLISIQEEVICSL